MRLEWPEGLYFQVHLVHLVLMNTISQEKTLTEFLQIGHRCPLWPEDVMNLASKGQKVITQGFICRL